MNAPLRTVLAACESADLLGVRVDVFVLEAEREGDAPMRVISGRGMLRAFGAGAKDGRIGRFIERITGDSEGLSLGPSVEFRHRGALHHGYEVTVLADLASVITDRALDGTLSPKQRPFIPRARQIEKQLTKLALVALVDEATGYQTQRGPTALNDLLRTYLLPVPGEWERAIPEELYVAVAALYGYDYHAGQGNRPAFLRSWTWRYVYQFLPREVRAEIQRTNPNPHEGGPKHHQCLTPAVRDVLRVHVALLVGVVRQSFTVADFRMRFARQFEGGGLQGSLFGNEPRAA